MHRLAQGDKTKIKAAAICNFKARYLITTSLKDLVDPRTKTLLKNATTNIIINTTFCLGRRE